MSPKETLRGKIKKNLAQIPKEEFGTQGACAAALLCNSPLWSACKTVFIFLSTHGEIDTRPLLETALREGKTVFAPKLGADKETAGKLVFHPVLGPDGPWSVGPFGIRQPLGGRTPEEEDFPALIITPGLAFDREGSRLGRGKGYYDRFFAELDAENKHYTAIGFCMDFQLVPLVPTGKNDKKVNGLVTGKELVTLK